jgi:hypothetical protein
MIEIKKSQAPKTKFKIPNIGPVDKGDQWYFDIRAKYRNPIQYTMVDVLVIGY